MPEFRTFPKVWQMAGAAVGKLVLVDIVFLVAELAVLALAGQAESVFVALATG